MSSLTYLQAMDIIGGSISKPSKMPWYGWSISAYMCNTGGKLRDVEGSVCSKCYACRGNYQFKNVQQSYEKRLEGLTNPLFQEAMIIVISKLYEREKRTYTKDGVVIKENRWRWFDSGDLQSLENLIIFNNIAESLPMIDFWLPTKEKGIVKQFLKTNSFAKNLNVRLSHPMIGQSFKSHDNSFNYSTVNVEKSTHHCLAPSQGNKCLECRQCWDINIKVVNYKSH